jgi:hypothetical protein
MKTEFKVALKLAGRAVPGVAHPLDPLDLLYTHIPPLDPTAHPSTEPMEAKYTDVMLHPFVFEHCSTGTACHQFEVSTSHVYAAGQ